jgi:type IV pilus assembly protein PilN
MIRINLVGGPRQASVPKTPLGATQKITIGCTLILVLAVGFIGWRYWTIARDSNQLDRDIAEAQQETTRLHAIIRQVQQFELRKTQLQQRVTLIEQLRKAQTGPVHILDQVSRSLPPAVWLTSLKQKEADVLVDGNASNLTSLADLVANLERSGYFARPIEIISTTTETPQQAPGELIKFSIKARYQPAGEATPPAATAKAGG